MINKILFHRHTDANTPEKVNHIFILYNNHPILFLNILSLSHLIIYSNNLIYYTTLNQIIFWGTFEKGARDARDVHSPPDACRSVLASPSVSTPSQLCARNSSDPLSSQLWWSHGSGVRSTTALLPDWLESLLLPSTRLRTR